MLIKLLSFVLFIYPINSLISAQTSNNEIVALDNLITSTQNTLNAQLKLREMILNYQNLQARYMRDEDNFELLYKVAKSARGIMELLEEQHLAQTFDPSFITELNIVSKPAAKRTIPLEAP